MNAQTNVYSKTCVNRPLSKIPRIGFQGKVSLNAVRISKHQGYMETLKKEHNRVYPQVTAILKPQTPSQVHTLMEKIRN